MKINIPLEKLKEPFGAFQSVIWIDAAGLLDGISRHL